MIIDNTRNVNNKKLVILFYLITMMIFILSSQEVTAPFISSTGYFFPQEPTYVAFDHTVIKKNGTYHIFYILANRTICSGSSSCNPNQDNFGHSTSYDMIDWIDESPVIPVGNPWEWDSSNVWAPHLIEVNGTYYMFYTGVNYTNLTSDRNIQQIGIATSTDLYNWTKYSGNPIFNCSSPLLFWQPGSSWSANCRDPNIFYDGKNNRYILVVSAQLPTGNLVIASAISYDLYNWFNTTPIYITNFSSIENPFLTFYNNTYYLYGTQRNSTNEFVAYFKSDDPLQGYDKVNPDPNNNYFFPLFSTERASEIVSINSAFYLTQSTQSLISYNESLYYYPIKLRSQVFLNNGTPLAFRLNTSLELCQNDYYITFECTCANRIVNNTYCCNTFDSPIPCDNYNQNFSIDLQRGINLISFPIILENNSIEYIFSQVNNSLESIYYYNSSDWLVYHKNSKLQNTLTYIQPKNSYFVFLNNDSVISFYGNVTYQNLTLPQKEFKNGWNLFGINSLNSIQAKDELKSINFTSIWEFNYTSYGQISINDLLWPGKGYWVFIQ